MLAATPKGVIYVYSPLIQTGDYYGFVTVLDNRSSYSVYTGIAQWGNYIYVCDFSNARVETYDYSWAAVRTHQFIDPDLPNGYSPFNVYTHDNLIYVIYAKVGGSSPQINQVAIGEGLGLIDIYNLDGVLTQRLTTGGTSMLLGV